MDLLLELVVVNTEVCFPVGIDAFEKQNVKYSVFWSNDFFEL